MKDTGTTPAKRLLTQPLVGALVGAFSLCVLIVLWLPWLGPGGMDTGPQAVFAVILVAGVILSYQFPIHIGYHHKIEVNTVPLYFIAVLLSPALAATAAGMGILVAEFAVRTRRGSYLSDIVTAAGRFVVVIMLASVVAHLPAGPGPFQVLPLLGAALTMWLGDVLTLPLILGPMSGDPPLQIIRGAVREGGDVEGAQYIVGFLGALAVASQPWVLVLLAVPIALVYLAFKSVKEMHEGTQQLLERIADTIDLRDPYTGGHSRRVMNFSADILRELKLSGAVLPLVLTAARLHDIGKIGVPDYVLHKAGPLTPEETAIMQLHPEQGADLLLNYPGFAHGAQIVRHHHERWDGTGYPHRLKGRDIPFGARVIAVADSYDAMTSERPYRHAMSPRTAADILRSGRGTQWDPEIVDAFLRVIADEVARSSVPRLQLVTKQDDDLTRSFGKGG